MIQRHRCLGMCELAIGRVDRVACLSQSVVEAGNPYDVESVSLQPSLMVCYARCQLLFSFLAELVWVCMYVSCLVIAFKGNFSAGPGLGSHEIEPTKLDLHGVGT